MLKLTLSRNAVETQGSGGSKVNPIDVVQHNGSLKIDKL